VLPSDSTREPFTEWVFAPDLEPYRRIGGRPIVERAENGAMTSAGGGFGEGPTVPASELLQGFMK
jgi:hypothetical protein